MTVGPDETRNKTAVSNIEKLNNTENLAQIA